MPRNAMPAKSGKPMVLSFSKAWQDVEGRTECNEFRQWIALKIVFAVTRSTRYGLRFSSRRADATLPPGNAVNDFH